MSWRLTFHPEVEFDVSEAAEWYEARQAGLGGAFVDDMVQLWRALEQNPLVGARRHPTKNLRWRHPTRFPYRVIYQVNEATKEVQIAAVIHAARHESWWLSRIDE